MTLNMVRLFKGVSDEFFMRVCAILAYLIDEGATPLEYMPADISVNNVPLGDVVVFIDSLEEIMKVSAPATPPSASSSTAGPSQAAHPTPTSPKKPRFLAWPEAPIQP